MTVTTEQTGRSVPSRPASVELDALKAALDHQREHVAGILEGLTEEELRRPMLPSGWSCLALVRHLTLDVEQFWFAGVIAGEPDVAGQLLAGTEAHWCVPDGMNAAEVFADYRTAIARADSVLADADLDQEPAAWPVEIWPSWRLPDVRRILIHVLTEVACHSGHLDAARELIDGTTWLGGNPYAG
ncbi:DinB family protein [Streptomyces sp. TRM66268-LWL]|uniref:DinB family protein n=1 Tax=Streptomyces polyasparticus TaxID=2767826 RepID=A0ABR7STI5_9ACTN|nr:DinB family protein [Streptomyces polyasparticus]MBC9718786.1 DinB family protein [Streptomyces polyasparticus]